MSTILFLHGALGSSQQFNTVIGKLSGFNCEAIDFPMHGNNQTISEFNINEFSEYLIRYIEQHHQEKVSVFGYSMGGYIALNAAYLRPDLFESIMTLATKFDWNEEIASKEIALLNPDEMQIKIPKFVEQLQQRHVHVHWKELLAKTAELIIDLGKSNLITKRLQEIQCKVMLGIGDKDTMVTLHETIDAYKQLSNGNLYVLPNTKHPFEKVNEAVLLAIIRDYFV